MAMTVHSYKTDSDIVKTEPNGNAGRDDIVIASGSGVSTVGTLLGKVTATGKFKPWAPAAADGTQTVAGVLLQHVDATSADVTAVALTRGTAELVYQGIVWPGGATDPQKAAALASLRSPNSSPLATESDPWRPYLTIFRLRNFRTTL